MKLDDTRSGAELRDEGMQRALAGAGKIWGAQAHAALVRFVAAHHGEEFTSDDIVMWVTKKKLVMPPSDPRAWGPIVRSAAKSGLIKDTRQFCISKRAVSHCRPMRLWAA